MEGMGGEWEGDSPVVELLAVVEEVRQQKVQQRPQLVEVVLQRRACHEHPVVALEPAHCVTQHRVLILEPVGLVHDDVLEAELLQDALLGVGGLVRRDNHVVLARDHVLLPHARPLLFAPVELEHRQVWAPLLHLFAPDLHATQRGGQEGRCSWGGGGGWHKASVSDCLPLAAPIGLSPLLILTLCGPERVLVVSTEPPDDLSCWTTPGVGRPGDGLLPVPLTRGIQMHPRGGGGDCGQGASIQIAKTCRNIGGKLQCSNRTSRSLKEQHLRTGGSECCCNFGW